MSALAGILDGSAAGPQDQDALDFWVELPPGYIPLPLQDPEETLAAAQSNLEELTPEDNRDLLAAVIGTFTLMLDQLQERNAVYCGLGWHTTEDGTVVSSSLVASIQPVREKRSPRLVLKDMIQLRAESGEHGQVDVVDLENGPALFFESVATLPRPQIPGRPPNENPDAEVYQLQALVPSDDGTKLVALDFSTPDIPHGPRFRAMMVLMANSVSFTAPAGAGAGSTAQSIGRILGGLDS